MNYLRGGKQKNKTKTKTKQNKTKQKERKKYIKTNGQKHNHDCENSVSCKIHDVLDKMATLIHIVYL